MKKFKLISCILLLIVIMFGTVSYSSSRRCTHSKWGYTSKLEVKPTCTQKGVSRKRCKNCNTVISEVYIKKLDHNYVHKTSQLKKVGTANSCRTTIKKYECSYCGSPQTTSTPDNSHNFKNATCISPKTCKDCGYQTGKKLGCSYGPWITIDEPTCTVKGSQKRVCSICNAIEFSNRDPLGHYFNEYVQEIGNDGSHYVKCNRCEEKIGESHDFYTSGICKKCGYNKGVNPSCDHSIFGINVTIEEATCLNGGWRVERCKGCNEIIKREENEPLKHDYSEYTKDDSKHYVECSRCGAVKDNKGEKHTSEYGKCTVCGYFKCAHREVEWETHIQPSCKDYGARRKICKNCGAIVGVPMVVPKLGNHKYVSYEPKVVKHYGKCSCGYVDEMGESHNFVNGVCTVCNYKSNIPIVDTNTCTHIGLEDYSKLEILLKATCTTKGKQGVRCPICKEIIKEFPLEPLGHDMTAYASDTTMHYPKCSRCGLVERGEKHNVVGEKCEVCKRPLENILCEHKTYDEVIKKATCTEYGSKTKVCTLCKYVLSETSIPILGHVENEKYEYDKGKHWKTCTICKETIQEYLGIHTPDWSVEGDKHYSVCSVCGYETDKESHNFEKNGNCICGESKCDHSVISQRYVLPDTCTGKKITIKECLECDWEERTESVYSNHKEEANWRYDSTRHWKNCSVCGNQITSTTASHSSHWENDGDRHYMECIQCGYRSSVGEHKFNEDGKCVCGATKVEAPKITLTTSVIAPARKPSGGSSSEGQSSKPNMETKPEDTPQINTGLEGNPEDTPQVNPEPEVKPEDIPQVNPEPEVKPEDTPQVNPEPEVKPEDTPQVNPEPEVKPEDTPQTNTDFSEPVEIKEFDVYYKNEKLEINSTTNVINGDILEIKVKTAEKSNIFYCWDKSLSGYNFEGIEGTLKIPEEFKNGSTHILSVTVDKDGSQYKDYKFKIIELKEPIIEMEFAQEVEVLNWEMESTELNSLAISLRNDSTSEKMNKNVYSLNEAITYYIDFKNMNGDISEPVEIKFELPLKFELVLIDNVGIAGNQSQNANITINEAKRSIVWSFPNGLKNGHSDTIKVVLRYVDLKDEYKIVYPLVSILRSNKVVDESAVINLVYKNSNTVITDVHEPYMRGDANATTFRPDDTITRAEGALVLARIMFGQERLDNIKLAKAFPDLDQTYEEAQKAIIAATSYGIINGYTDGYYRPNKTMTRAEFMKILATYIELNAEDLRIKGLTVKKRENLIKFYYVDNSTNVDEHWAIEEVTLLARLNMLPLNNKNIDLRMDEQITRAEVAQLVNFFLLRAPAVVRDSNEIKFSDVNINHDLVQDIIEATREVHEYRIYLDGTEDVAYSE